YQGVLVQRSLSARLYSCFWLKFRIFPAAVAGRKVKNLRRPFGPGNLEDRNQNDGAKSADRGERERLPKQALASLTGTWQDCRNGGTALDQESRPLGLRRLPVVGSQQAAQMLAALNVTRFAAHFLPDLDQPILQPLVVSL